MTGFSKYGFHLLWLTYLSVGCQDSDQRVKAENSGFAAAPRMESPVLSDPTPEEEQEREGPLEPVDPRPSPGELRITEVMYDPALGLEDVHAEWIEIQNQSQRALNLDDCVITDAAHLEQRAKQADLNGIWVEPMDYLLVMRSADRLLNGDLQPDSLFAFGLGNGGDHILVLCAGELIDEMDFDSGGNYPAAKGRSVQLYDDEWCPAESIYHAISEQRGTPRAPNAPCPTTDTSECWYHDQCGSRGRCIDNQCEQLEAGCTEELCNPPVMQTDCDGTECQQSGTEEVQRGELVITEFLYDPVGALSDRSAEWIELKNVSGKTLNLQNCVVNDQGESGSALSNSEFFLEDGAFFLLARSVDTTINGGLEADSTFRFGLNNGGDEIRLFCGDELIDSVLYGTSGLSATGASLSRSGPVVSTENQIGTDWCEGTSAYFDAPEHLGTPGTENPPCPTD